jgi:hypothetical protein
MIRVELFSSAEPSGATLTVPELGSPSVWRVSRTADGSVLGFRLRNRDAPNEAGDFQCGTAAPHGQAASDRTSQRAHAERPAGAGRYPHHAHDRCPLRALPRRYRCHGPAGKIRPESREGSGHSGLRDRDARRYDPCGATPGVYECMGDCPPGECVVADPITPTCHCVGPVALRRRTGAHVQRLVPGRLDLHGDLVRHVCDVRMCRSRGMRGFLDVPDVRRCMRGGYVLLSLFRANRAVPQLGGVHVRRARTMQLQRWLRVSAWSNLSDPAGAEHLLRLLPVIRDGVDPRAFRH